VIRIAIAGAGRMGQAIAAIAAASADLEVTGVWHRGDDLERLVADADVVVDFSLPAGTESVLDVVSRQGKPLVCGVSGLDDTQIAALERTARTVPVVYDRNMSLGIAVLERVVREAAASLGMDFEASVSEVHHVHKKDAPSGTALKLGEAIAEARGESDTTTIRYSSERRGEVPGDHEVVLQSSTERLSFGHSVTTRQVFADGALRAARWIVGRPPGRYCMRDVLFS